MIKIQDLTKYYGKRLAVDDISFNVEKGEIVGFLGPNGAGKTTTMRIITGYLMANRGQVCIGDYDMAIQSRQGRRLMGYLPEMVPLYTDMTTRAYLEFTARLRGLDSNEIKRGIEEVVAKCSLDEYVDVMLSKLSKGYRQRVGLAQAIIHDPPVLILDEPTVGIDPIQVAQTRQLIKTLGQERTILLSTHVLSEVSMICERVIIIHEGRIVAQDRIDDLSARLEVSSRLRLKIEGPAKKVTDSLKRLSSVRDVRHEQPHHIVEFSTDQQPQAEITKMVVRNGWTLLAMESVDMNLEDIFLQLTGEKEAEG